MRRLVMAVVLVITVCGLAHAGQGGHFTKLYSIPGLSCGEWVKADATTKQADIAWMFGFLSGAGMFGPQMRPTAIDAVPARIDNYCSSNPLKGIESAAEALAKELAKKSTTQPKSN